MNRTQETSRRPPMTSKDLINLIYLINLINRHSTVSSRSFDLLNSMIYDLKRSVDLRWLFDPLLHSSLHDLVRYLFIVNYVWNYLPAVRSALKNYTNWVPSGNQQQLNHLPPFRVSKNAPLSWFHCLAFAPLSYFHSLDYIISLRILSHREIVKKPDILRSGWP